MKLDRHISLLTFPNLTFILLTPTPYFSFPSAQINLPFISSGGQLLPLSLLYTPTINASPAPQRQNLCKATVSSTG